MVNKNHAQLKDDIEALLKKLYHLSVFQENWRQVIFDTVTSYQDRPEASAIFVRNNGEEIQVSTFLQAILDLLPSNQTPSIDRKQSVQKTMIQNIDSFVRCQLGNDSFGLDISDTLNSEDQKTLEDYFFNLTDKRSGRTLRDAWSTLSSEKNEAFDDEVRETQAGRPRF